MKKIIGLIIIIGSISWLLTMVKSGYKFEYGLGFWGPNGHDGVWHVALANSLSNFDFSNPVFAGSVLQNYHIGFDLILGLLSKITFIPILNLYFQVLPIIFSILTGLLSYKFVYLWTKNKFAGASSTFFIYFGGSFAWVLGKGESAFWSQQSISTLINPPFALSLLFLLSGLIFVLKKRYSLSVLFFSLLIFIKVYAGLLVLGALAILGIYTLMIKRETKWIKIFISTFLISFLLYLPFNKISTSLIEFQPFWFLETMMSYSDRLGWQRFYSAMTTYRMGNLYLKEVLSLVVAFLIFIFGNFWTRLIFLKDIFKKADEIKIILLLIVFEGVLMPTFFVQTGTPWNTIQFMYYSLFFSGVLAGIALSRASYYILLVTILLTVPTTIITLKDVYIPSRPPAKLSNFEIEALNFLKQMPDGVVLTYPYDQDKAKEAVNNPPRPLYLYESTAYVSAFSQKTVFLEDEVNLNITGYDWRKRREEVTNWYKERDPIKAKKFLKDNNIKYIYWVKGVLDGTNQRALLGEGQLGLTNIFENDKTVIFSVESNN